MGDKNLERSRDKGVIMKYFCKIELEDGLYGATFPDFPNVITVGGSVDEALAMAHEALNASLACDVARGMPLPKATAAKKGLYPVEVLPHILIAWQIREIRGKLSQSEIAQRMGLSYQSYQRLENPVKGNPTIKTLERIAKVMGKQLSIQLV